MFKVLYSFCGQLGCGDGTQPRGELLPDGAGGYFGTTTAGGGFGGGEVFDLVPNGDGWSLHSAYMFCMQTDCADGKQPQGALIADAAGDLYGITYLGGNASSGQGAGDSGIVYELAPNAGHTGWIFNVLYRFCAKPGCRDGQHPLGLTYTGQASGATYDGVAPLYGTTHDGGDLDAGVAFVLKRNAKGRWKEGAIHSFCNLDCKNDGAFPDAPIMDGTGHMFGSAAAAGRYGFGAVFEISRRHGAWSERLVYSFCAHVKNCPDGQTPLSPLLIDASGDLVGTTSAESTVFKLAPDGHRYDASVLYTFCSLRKCADGNAPNGQLVLDPSGNILGTTAQGGGSVPEGVVYALGPDYQVLHAFCAEPQCTDGATPAAGVTRDASGNLFGTTTAGGGHNGGEIYELMP
jgi:hypothetical protein